MGRGGESGGGIGVVLGRYVYWRGYFDSAFVIAVIVELINLMCSNLFRFLTDKIAGTYLYRYGVYSVCVCVGGWVGGWVGACVRACVFMCAWRIMIIFYY